MYDLSIKDGEILTKAARNIVTEFLKNNKKPQSELDSRFSAQAGVFVTLNKNNDLRGCIGYPLPSQSLSKGLEDAALAAALDDPRFDSVTLDELDSITFEITVLTPPQRISVNDIMEYPSKIKIGRDGLIVKHSLHSGLLLPQVPVEYGWNEEEFLEHTCEKAGLAKNFWRYNEMEISKFQGIIFKEEEPNGRIIKASLCDRL